MIQAYTQDILMLSYYAKMAKVNASFRKENQVFSHCPLRLKRVIAWQTKHAARTSWPYIKLKTLNTYVFCYFQVFWVPRWAVSRKLVKCNQEDLWSPLYSYYGWAKRVYRSLVGYPSIAFVYRDILKQGNAFWSTQVQYQDSENILQSMDHYKLKRSSPSTQQHYSLRSDNSDNKYVAIFYRQIQGVICELFYYLLLFNYYLISVRPHPCLRRRDWSGSADLQSLQVKKKSVQRYF